MDLPQFRASLAVAAPPEGLELALQALWWDAKGDWVRAHALVDELESPEGMAVHAYLHRKEGDLGNAGHWYGRTGKPVCREPLDAEWPGIVGALLG